MSRFNAGSWFHSLALGRIVFLYPMVQWLLINVDKRR